MEIHLEEIQNEGLLVSWVFKDRPDLNLSVLPRLQLHEVSYQQQVAGLELSKGGSGGNGAEPGGRLLRRGKVGNSLSRSFRARQAILSPWNSC